MKITFPLAACIAAILLVACLSRGDAQSKSLIIKKEVVMFTSVSLWTYDGSTSISSNAGFGVYNYACSDGAPYIGTPVYNYNAGGYQGGFVNSAQVISDLLSQGYRMEHVHTEGQGQDYVFVK
jgi:hypothetical protein